MSLRTFIESGWLVLLVVGCSSGTSLPEQEPRADAAPSSCDRSDRSGLYAEHLVERAGGTCGPMPDVLVELSESPTLEGCTFDAPDKLSADQCTESRAFTCPVGTMSPRSVVSVTTDVNKDGSRFVETLELTEYDADGAPLCSSTYDITFTRE